MCGIVGILNSDINAPVSKDILLAMNNAITHRGPDDSGHLIDRNVGIAMRRLSVIDVAGGHQPISNENKTCHIVFNGEIYNYPELRKTCQGRGHRLSTQSDTESIVHLYEDDAENCVMPLNGMFAFAIFDQKKRNVLIARDRLGIKPLYYAQVGSLFVFASEIKALLQHPDISQEMDTEALNLYLSYKYIPGERTIYKHIKKLLPGHILNWQAGQINIRPYWKLSFAQKLSNRSEADIAAELQERLRQAVKSQMISDVPLGALLSGGIDSSYIVALMSQLTDQPVQTFSIGFEEQSYNELAHAQTIADHFGTQHHPLVVNPNINDLFEQVIGHFDEPFGDSSAIPTYLVSQLARSHVTVALSGTGADELFAGYERYWNIPLSRGYTRVPKIGRRAFENLIHRLPAGHHKKSLIHRAQRFTQALSGDLLTRHQSIISLFSQSHQTELLHPDIYRPQLQDDPLYLKFSESDASNALDQLLDVDTSTLLSDDYLVKDDRMSMAVSLELRVPFLDHTLVEFAAQIPSHLKLRHLTTKYILKKAAKGLLPPHILKRPKHGFEMPVAHWLNHELHDMVHDLLLSPHAQTKNLLNKPVIADLVETHKSGRENLNREIWSLLSLELWLRNQQNHTQPSATLR
ncbi:MAG: asparagine synthase (glutamine-hydrolyzing) [Candidatus Latescibacteria bacterium]|nr:asparagine synthase (glutamine-hydrolyzing) [Candidatus Latescibacterota bacterium]